MSNDMFEDYDSCDEIVIGDDTATGKGETERPSMYKVIILNDDYTPFDLVVDVIHKVFNMDIEKAGDIAFAAHQSGKAICGTFTRDIAETKTEQINSLGAALEFPLKTVIEKE